MNVYQKPNKYNKNNYREYIPPNYSKFQEQYESEDNELITPDIPMTFKKMNSLLSHVNDMIDIRLARNVEGKPCIISGKMHLHMAMFFEDNGSNIIPLSYGQNGATIYNLCHAEHNALLKLKNRDTKKITGINLLVIKTTLTGVIGSSKPCAHCLALLCTLPIKKGYKVNNVFYSNSPSEILVKKKLNDLLLEDLHISRMYSDKGYKPRLDKFI
jgi:cytidine deaminase